ncbi:MAG: hypothetical protein ABSG94_07420 [Brevinematales bacterium]|jgi:hypothetical protein
MENLKALQNLGSVVNALLNFIGPIAAVAQFLFLTFWGWLIIVFFILIIIAGHAKDKSGHFSMTGLLGAIPELLFGFYSSLANIVIGLVLIFFIGFVYSTIKDLSTGLSLYRDVKMMEAALRNLKSERKVMEIKALPVINGDKRSIDVKITYFAYSPAKDADVTGGSAEYNIQGRKLFVDFGVLNFDYTLIEKGEIKNIAFPDKLFSDTVSHDGGVNIFTGKDQFPATFNVEDKDLFILNKGDFQTEVLKFISAVTNAEAARKLGIRTAYGEAIGIFPSADRVYTFYSTGTGGVIVR